MDEDFWKKAGEAIDTQIKELAKRRAINTAKYLNEIHGAARKEMNKDIKAWMYEFPTGSGKVGLSFEEPAFAKGTPLYSHPGPDAFAEIKRLEAEVKEHIVKIKDLEDFFVGWNHRVDTFVKMNAELIREKIRLEGQVKELEQNWNDELRDQFACAAMEGIISAQGWHPEYIIPAGGGHVAGQCAADAAAESAYKYADAMLKAREK